MGITHFQNLFKAPREPSIAEILRVAQFFPSFINGDKNEDLLAEISKNEMEVLHSFQKDKIMGLDWWPIEFFMGFYDLIGRDLLKVVEESKLEGHIHTPLNSTFIALIPKTGYPLTFEEYIPISLCNCLYKIISKVIAKCLKSFLSRRIYFE